jgi:hypothetical protein
MHHTPCFQHCMLHVYSCLLHSGWSNRTAASQDRPANAVALCCFACMFVLLHVASCTCSRPRAWPQTCGLSVPIRKGDGVSAHVTWGYTRPVGCSHTGWVCHTACLASCDWACLIVCMLHHAHGPVKCPWDRTTQSLATNCALQRVSKPIVGASSCINNFVVNATYIA